jgi:hypothetical protein
MIFFQMPCLRNACMNAVAGGSNKFVIAIFFYIVCRRSSVAINPFYDDLMSFSAGSWHEYLGHVYENSL